MLPVPPEGPHLYSFFIRRCGVSENHSTGSDQKWVESAIYPTQPAVESPEINPWFVEQNDTIGYACVMKGGARYGSDQNWEVHSGMP
jgi:hypothetical protein